MEEVAFGVAGHKSCSGRRLGEFSKRGWLRGRNVQDTVGIPGWPQWREYWERRLMGRLRQGSGVFKCIFCSVRQGTYQHLRWPVSLLFTSSFLGLLSSSPIPPASPAPGAKSPFTSPGPQPHTHSSPSCRPNYLLITCQDVCFSGGSLEHV